MGDNSISVPSTDIKKIPFTQLRTQLISAQGVTTRFSAHIMATPGIEDVPESEHWEQDELSEMMSLLQRAEQRMRKSDQACKHTVRAQKIDKYATVPSFTHITNLTLSIDYPS